MPNLAQSALWLPYAKYGSKCTMVTILCQIWLAQSALWLPYYAKFGWLNVTMVLLTIVYIEPNLAYSALGDSAHCAIIGTFLAITFAPFLAAQTQLRS